MKKWSFFIATSGTFHFATDSDQLLQPPRPPDALPLMQAARRPHWQRDRRERHPPNRQPPAQRRWHLLEARQPQRHPASALPSPRGEVGCTGKGRNPEQNPVRGGSYFMNPPHSESQCIRPRPHTRRSTLVPMVRILKRMTWMMLMMSQSSRSSCSSKDSGRLYPPQALFPPSHP